MLGLQPDNVWHLYQKFTRVDFEGNGTFLMSELLDDIGVPISPFVVRAFLDHMFRVCTGCGARVLVSYSPRTVVSAHTHLCPYVCAVNPY